MTDMLANSAFFCITLTIGAFCLGAVCQKKWGLAILNPIITGAALVMLTLTVLRIPVEAYQENCKLLSWLLTPATICLAISFAEQLEKLKKHLAAVIAGVLAGTVCSIGSVVVLAKAFGLSEVLTYSLLPKSTTSAIGMALSEQAGGISAVTTVIITVTGILGNIAGPAVVKLLRIREPVAQGVAFGTTSHVIGTSKAVELSPLAGAVSSLSLTLAGLVTTVIFSALLSI